MRRKFAKKMRRKAVKTGVVFNNEKWMFSKKEVKSQKLRRKHNRYMVDALYNNNKLRISGKDELEAYQNLKHEIIHIIEIEAQNILEIMSGSLKPCYTNYSICKYNQEYTSENDSSLTNIKQLEGSLESLGIIIKNKNGEYRYLYDILGELSAKLF